MLVSTALFALLSLASANPVPASVNARDLSECTGDFSFDIDTFKSLGVEACGRLFPRGPASPSQATAQVWTGYSNEDGKKLATFKPYNFALEGDVDKMDKAKCEYAFTGAEALDANSGAGRVCKGDGGKMNVMGWEFEKDGRKYKSTKGGAEEKETDSNARMPTFWT